MAYLLNTVNLTTYGIKAGHVPGSNISLQGCFDLPARIGKTFHDWGEEDGIEPYVETSEIFFGGRDIVFHGFILGTNAEINVYLKTFYDAIKAFTDLVVFSTPYGNFSVQVKNIDSEYLNGGAKIVITFREPVVTLTGGTLPAAGSSAYTIDGIPFSSFGLYLSKAEALHNLPDLKEQYFTKYGSEGYQISKRKNNTLDINGFIMGSSLADFQSKVLALYKLLSSSGVRTITFVHGKECITCFAAEGFMVDNILMHGGGIIANFKMNLICVDIYNTVTIGTQVWMAENLKTTKYNDGSSIPLVTDNTAWAALITGAYCHYNNTPANSAIYGKLYNWHAVNTGKLAPKGWHVPTNDEWITLMTYLGGNLVAGGKLKETGTAHWAGPNNGATNEVGFKALPGGFRDDSGTFSYIRNNGSFASSTEYSASDAWFKYIYNSFAYLYSQYTSKKYGLSVRCIKDV